MRIWQSQDACALAGSWSWARNLQENRLFLTASGVGTEVPPGPLLFHENARYPIIAGWTGGVGGRQMEN